MWSLFYRNERRTGNKSTAIVCFMLPPNFSRAQWFGASSSPSQGRNYTSHLTFFPKFALVLVLTKKPLSLLLLIPCASIFFKEETKLVDFTQYKLGIQIFSRHVTRQLDKILENCRLKNSSKYLLQNGPSLMNGTRWLWYFNKAIRYIIRNVSTNTFNSISHLLASI